MKYNAILKLGPSRWFASFQNLRISLVIFDPEIIFLYYTSQGDGILVFLDHWVMLHFQVIGHWQIAKLKSTVALCMKVPMMDTSLSRWGRVLESLLVLGTWLLYSYIVTW